jgi:Uma2 family endonuclease
LLGFEEYLLIDGRRRSVERYRRAADGPWTYWRYASGDTVIVDTIDLACPLDAFYIGTTL